MLPTEEAKRVRLALAWNAGRSAKGGKAVDNVLFGASWSHWGLWPERQTHIYLGLWTLTITTPSKGGKVRTDIRPATTRSA